MTTYTYQERFRTEKGVFDEFTKRTLFDLSSSGHFDELLSPLFVGKESNVFIARKGKGKVIVKIYRIQTCDFTKMYGYIRQDSRYDKLKRNRRQIIFAWTQREFKNLMRAVEAGIRVPKPIVVKNNVLIEEMIGRDEPAAQLKNLAPENEEKFMDDLIKQVTKLYQKANIVHGDLSAFNILNYKEKPVLIDFSQGTLAKSSDAHRLLKRDLKNIATYSRKLNIKFDVEKIFKQITE